MDDDLRSIAIEQRPEPVRRIEIEGRPVPGQRIRPDP